MTSSWMMTAADDMTACFRSNHHRAQPSSHANRAVQQVQVHGPGRSVACAWAYLRPACGACQPTGDPRGVRNPPICERGCATNVHG